MADRPILFSAPMVRALLDGRKTQTRRICKGANEAHLTYAVPLDVPPQPGWFGDEEGDVQFFSGYAPGDRLWVRESGIEMRGIPGVAGDLFRHDVPATPERGVYWSRENEGPGAGYIVAGCSRESALVGERRKVRPAIHMPRWASRLTLTVTDVRVERLHDISDEDAKAEGARYTEFGHAEPRGEASLDGGKTWFAMAGMKHPGWHVFDVEGPMECLGTPSAAFANLWGHINGPGAWEANPWVVAVSFTVGHHNIDAVVAS